MAINNTSNTGDDGVVYLQDVESLTTGVVDGKTLVFTAGRDDFGISVFELNDDGTLTNLFNIGADQVPGLEKLSEVHFVPSGSGSFLVAGGNEDDLEVFRVNTDGTLDHTDTVDVSSHAGSSNVNIDGLTSVEIDGKTFVIAGGAASDSLSVFQLNPDGTLTAPPPSADLTSGSSSVNDAAAPWLQLDGIRDVVTATAGGNTYVIAAGREDDGLTVLRLGSDGLLRKPPAGEVGVDDSSDPNLLLDGVTALATHVTGDGTTYVYAGSSAYATGANESGISVFRLNDDGSLTNTANYPASDADKLFNLTSLTTGTTVGGKTYLFAVGDGIDGLQVYTVEDDGSLAFFDYVADDGTQYLGNAEDVTTAIVDGKLHVLAGGDENGVSVYTVPCFVAGTLIATPRGPRPVESLQPGDSVITLDAGPQPLRLVAKRALTAEELALHPHLRPVRIAAGSLGPGLPRRDLLVSPQHRLLVQGAGLNLNLGLDEALAPAAGLVGARGVTVERRMDSVRYVHLGFDRHHVVLSEGLASESFLPGPGAVAGLDAPVRAELMELFPDLRVGDMRGFAPARPILTAREARFLAATGWALGAGGTQASRRALIRRGPAREGKRPRAMPAQAPGRAATA